jgi:hypothetical protein
MLLTILILIALALVIEGIHRAIRFRQLPMWRYRLPDGSLPSLSGGDPDNITYPPAPATIANGRISIDWLLADPRRVTRAIANIALQRFYVNRIFAPAGNIVGGAVLYEQRLENDLYASRDVGRVNPGDEFPIVTFERGEALTAQVEKFGGKFPVTDEARRRGQAGRVVRAMGQLANTITRKTQQRALGELTAAIGAFGRTGVGTSWADAAAVAEASRTNLTGPISDLTSIEEQNEILELGYTYNLAIMNPQEWRNFRLAAGGSAADARALLSDSGITDVWVTNRKAAGSVYWLAEGQVGELGYELPLSTETWRDKDGKQQDWFQSFVLPVMYVTDPYAIMETTGHAA